MRNTGVEPMVWMHNAWRNRVQSLLLLLFMGGFLGLLGWVLWGSIGLALLLLAGLFAVFANPSFSPRLVMRLYGARRLDSREFPELHYLVAELSRRADLPRQPDLYLVPSRVLNAFAVGAPGRSALALTDGMLRTLARRELVGVLAHEVSHIHNNDLWVMGLADLLSRATSMLSLLGQFLLLLNLPLILLAGVSINWWAIVLLIFAPHVSALAQLALSRTREYDADLNAARLSGDPEGLARALARIEQAQGGWMENILLPGRRVPEPSLLRTHPPVEERIRRLLSLAPQDTGFTPVQPSVTPLRPRPGLGPLVSRAPGWHLNGLWH